MPSRPEGSAPVALEHAGEVCRVAGVLDFDTARDALERVAPLIERGAVSSVDLGGVTRSNSAGLALMIEWLATARRAGHPLRFDGVPDGLRQLAGVFQVGELLGASVDTPAVAPRAAPTGGATEDQVPAAG